MKIRVLALSAFILLTCLTPASAWVARARAELSTPFEAALDAYWAFAVYDDNGNSLANNWNNISGHYDLHNAPTAAVLETTPFNVNAGANSRSYTYVNVAEGSYLTYTYGMADCGLGCSYSGKQEDTARSFVVHVVFEDPPEDEYGEDEDDEDCCSPLVLDLDHKGFRFTDVKHGVEFDINADGLMESIAWTGAGSGDAFLALDRNLNGVVDGGGELFGNFTSQPESSAPNGFEALAVFDWPENGGDGDGEISPADTVFDGLLLWTDTNHDGFSQYDELNSLDWHEVVSISLRYRETRRTDPHGNQLRYLGKFRHHGNRQGNITDVFFSIED